jgi:hypothetical protein
LAALEAQQAGQVGPARELSEIGAPLISELLTPEQVWQTIAILIDLDRVEEAIGWTHQLMQQWATIHHLVGMGISAIAIVLASA